MNKVDDILEKLKNTEQPQIDLTEEIMNSLTPRPLQGERERKRRVLWPLTIAAFVAGFIVIFLALPREATIELVEQPVVVQQPEEQKTPVVNEEPAETITEVTVPKKTKRAPKRRQAVQQEHIEEPMLTEVETTKEASTENIHQRRIDASNPYLLAAAQAQDIRSRGERLSQEVASLIEQ